MHDLPALVVAFVIISTVHFAYRFVVTDWRVNTVAKIVLLLLTLAGIVILMDNGTLS